MLFLMPFYLLLVLIFIFIFIHRYKGMKKFYAFFIWAFILYLPVGWDVISGRTYLFYLCHTDDAGVNIYKTVELGPEYWNENGSPKFYDKRGGFDESMFDGAYERKRTSKKYTDKYYFNGSRHTSQIRYRESGEVFGEIVYYNYSGGWVMNTGNPFGPPGGASCPQYSDYVENPNIKKWKGYIHKQYGDYLKFTSYIFLKK